MEYRKLGTSDLSFSVVTFGARAAGGWIWDGKDYIDLYQIHWTDPITPYTGNHGSC